MARKTEELALFVEAAFKRKQWMALLADADIPLVIALGRQCCRDGCGARLSRPARPNGRRGVAALEKAGGGLEPPSPLWGGTADPQDRQGGEVR